MMHDVVREKKGKHSDDAKKQCSSRLLEDDIPETYQEVQTPRSAGHSQKKPKKKKTDHFKSLGGCDSSKTVRVDTDQDLQNLQYVGDHKKKERQSCRSEGEDDDSEVQTPRLAGHGEKKAKKTDRFRSLGGCDSSETAVQDLQSLQYVGDGEKKRRKKARHDSRSAGSCDDSEEQNFRLVGDGETKKKRRRPRSADGGDASQTSTVETEGEMQHSRLMGNEDNQKNKKKHQSRSAEEAGVSESAAKTKRKRPSAGLVDSGVKKKDHIKAAKEDDAAVAAKESPQAMQNPALVGGRDGQKKKRKHCSSSAEDGDVSPSTAVEIRRHKQSSLLDGDGENRKRKNHHYRSAEGGHDSETAAEDPRQDSGISESTDIDTETSTKKRKKKKTQFVIDINRDVSLNASEILQKSIKKRKISGVLPFETVVEESSSVDLLESLDKSFKKHKVKCSPGGIAENRATNHSKAVKDCDFAEIAAEQTEQTMHNSSTGCQETVTTSKKCKQKKGSLSGYSKSDRRIKNLRQCSALSTENTLKVTLTPEAITEPNKSLETPKRRKKKPQRYVSESNNNGSTAVEHFQEEAIPFCQDTPEGKMMQKSPLVQVLKEFIPNVEKMATGTVYSIYKYDLPRFQQLKKQGIPIRQGKFTKEENQQLQKNLKALMELTGIEKEWEFFHVPESLDEMMRIKQLKMTNSFCCRIAEGIPRPWKCVYQRAKKMYDPNRCKGRYTNEELEKLQRLQVVHGNHWKKIAELMDRSDTSVLSRARTIKSSLSIGSWSKEEEKAFMKIMEQVMKSRIQESSLDLTITASSADALVSILREKLYKGIPWCAVADQMEHRNLLQCRQKWMSILTTKMSGRMMSFGSNRYQTKINLIKRLYLLGVDDIGDVDWEELCNVVGDVPPVFVQRMFYKLKTRYVPDWPKKLFGEIVDFLHEQIIPQLEALLRKEKAHKIGIGVDGIYQPQQHVFKLSDIFDDDEEDEIVTKHPLE